MAEKGHLSLGKSLGTGIDNAYLKRWLAFYGGKDPWVESVHGKVRVYGGGNTTGATGVTVANSGSDSGGQDFFSWILSTFKKVAVSLFGESSLDAQGVDIWSTTKVPEYPKQPKNEWQPAVDHYSWDSRTLHLKNEQVLDLGREWMMDLMTQNGQTLTLTIHLIIAISLVVGLTTTLLLNSWKLNKTVLIIVLVPIIVIMMMLLKTSAHH